ncbi:MAG TPA: response regulator transcription factor [Candidatus Binataceae bacterium]|nr:response regulator transcription factor [Candidatus Binataceae bacterium]
MSPSERIRILLADDHRILREALRALLAADCDIVGEASSGEAAVDLAVKLKPQVAVVDLRMSGMDGFAAARRIGREVPGCKVLVLSQYDDEESVVEALGEAGAHGFVVKTDAADELLAAVRAVHAGRRYISPSVAPIVIGRLSKPAAPSAATNLTRREREVLRLIADGATAKEIARRLKISPKTAQVHRDNLKQKLNLRSTAAMVRYAIKHKLVRLD